MEGQTIRTVVEALSLPKGQLWEKPQTPTYGLAQVRVWEPVTVTDRLVRRAARQLLSDTSREHNYATQAEVVAAAAKQQNAQYPGGVQKFYRTDSPLGELGTPLRPPVGPGPSPARRNCNGSCSSCC